MRVLVLNASPKRKGGASRLFSAELKAMLAGCRLRTCDVRGRHDYAGALRELSWAQAVVISLPLYVDGIPSSLLPFLEEAEELCRKKHLQFKLYVISNCGFVEGVQNATHLKMYKAWCQRAGVSWGGGLGIGGGVILHVFSILFPVFIGVGLIKIIICKAMGVALSGADVFGCFETALWMLFFQLGQLVCEGILAGKIRAGGRMKNLFIRPLLPSFVFLPVADAFMLLSALFKGTLPHRVFRRYDVPKECAREKSAVSE